MKQNKFKLSVPTIPSNFYTCVEELEGEEEISQLLINYFQNAWDKYQSLVNSLRQKFEEIYAFNAKYFDENGRPEGYGELQGNIMKLIADLINVFNSHKDRQNLTIEVFSFESMKNLTQQVIKKYNKDEIDTKDIRFLILYKNWLITGFQQAFNEAFLKAQDINEKIASVTEEINTIVPAADVFL